MLVINVWYLNNQSWFQERIKALLGVLPVIFYGRRLLGLPLPVPYARTSTMVVGEPLLLPKRM